MLCGLPAVLCLGLDNGKAQHMPVFQQRHYEALAQLMRDAKVQDDTDQQGGLDMIERMMVEMFKRDNPKFQPARFEKAAAVGEG